jgi:hypothetical protein
MEVNMLKNKKKEPKKIFLSLAAFSATPKTQALRTEELPRRGNSSGQR